MQLYTLTNKGKNVIRVFANSPERAKDIAFEQGFTKKRDNLFISAERSAPQEYHEGVASYVAQVSSFNLETLKIETPEDDGSLGWYGGDKQQPKVDNDWWN
jgi:hypothetical protein